MPRSSDPPGYPTRSGATTGPVRTASPRPRRHLHRLRSAAMYWPRITHRPTSLYSRARARLSAMWCWKPWPADWPWWRSTMPRRRTTSSTIRTACWPVWTMMRLRAFGGRSGARQGAACAPAHRCTYNIAGCDWQSIVDRSRRSCSMQLQAASPKMPDTQYQPQAFLDSVAPHQVAQQGCQPRRATAAQEAQLTKATNPSRP